MTITRREICFVWLTAFSMTASAKSPWDLKRLSTTPHVYDAPAPQAPPGMRAIYYEGLPWKDKPTRVFAWYAAPATKNGERLPAMVLVHGGGGTAFADWVKIWNDRGYAAIAIDTCGSVPEQPDETPTGGKPHPRHDFSGPPGWDASFDQVDWPVKDQWTYHAVAGILLANSLLRSFPEVDPNRIGLTGISWGGYLTAIAGSVDPRFRFAVPVYGCGFLGEDSVWLPSFAKLGPQKAQQWLKLWDPSVYLKEAKIPFLWVSGTNDFAYPMGSLQKSYRLPHGPRTLSIRLRMPHGHKPGETPEEIHAFANQYLKGGAPLPSIRKQGYKGQHAWLKFRAKTPVVRAELNYTRDGGVWEKRQWESTTAALDGTNRVAAELPPAVRVYYFNLIDEKGLAVSSGHVEIRP
jgi:dienelactone hydrolase